MLPGSNEAACQRFCNAAQVHDCMHCVYILQFLQWA